MLSYHQIHPHFFCVDTNPEATKMTLGTFIQNKVENFDIVNGNLIDCFEKRLKVDVLLFNPPYVPSDEEELGKNDIYASFAGGLDGREIIDVLLPRVEVRFLSIIFRIFLQIKEFFIW